MQSDLASRDIGSILVVFKNRASKLPPFLAWATQRISWLGWMPKGSKLQGISVLHELVDVALEIIEKLSGHVSVMVVPMQK